MRTKPIHVYLAAKFSRRDEMREVAAWLGSLGYVVTSRWLQVEEDMLNSPEGPQWAAGDVEDVLNSDVVVFFSEAVGAPGAERGGRHVEFGVGVAAGKKLIVVGHVENIFHRHPRVVLVEGWTGIERALHSYSEAS